MFRLILTFVVLAWSPILASSVHADGVEVYRRVAPSTVEIMPLGQSMPRGTGTLIDVERRLVVTADHVVSGLAKVDGQERVTVLFAERDGKGKIVNDVSHYVKNFDMLAIPGTVVWRESGRDLALVQLDRLPKDRIAVTLAAIGPEPGDSIHAIGMSNAQHGGVFGYCAGHVRNVFRWRRLGGSEPALIVAHHAPTNKGDSGGPVLNDRGELVGVVSTGTTGEPASPGDWTFQQQVVDHSIHVDEIRTMLSNYFSATEMTRETRALIEQLRHANEAVRMEAAKRLGMMGSQARGSLPALRHALADPDPDVRVVAANAIRRIQALSTRPK